ncbi:MAG TPA: hypothetical protein VE956_01635 [Nodularia sp. (in: cyanobacteria)]|nr:hypothetical protein [Nodularia sp. (in: cyanobacteria)]
MNAVLPRFLKSVYRRDPIISVLMTVGVVDSLIGGLNDSWSLFAVGLGTAGISLAFKLWRIQQRQPLGDQPVAQYYLPSQSSSPTLPMLTISKKKPPGKDIVR